MSAANQRKILCGMIIAYIVFFSIFNSFRHYNFQTQTWDLAVFSQSLWNTLQGKIMQNNLEEAKNTLGVHFSPFLFLLVPGYALFPTPYFLLIAQTIALGLGAWPLYLLALEILNKKDWAVIAAAGYLLYPSLHWINIFDFHPVTFLVPLLIASFYFMETKQWGRMFVFLGLALSTREDSILAVLFLGIYLFLRSAVEKNKKEMAIGFSIALISALYFLITIKLIMPALGGGLLRIDRYAHLGQTPAEIIKNIPKTIFNIKKFGYLFWLFLPVAFLPFFSGLTALLIIPGLVENLLTNSGFQFSGFYHYDSVLIPGIFIAAIYGIKNLSPKTDYLKKLLIFAIALGYIVRSPVNPIFFPFKIFGFSPRWEAYRQMISMVPDNASVAAQTNLVPHLSNREHIYMLGTEPFPVDIVLIDGADMFSFKDENSFQNYVDNYVNSGNYRIRSLNNRYLILTKDIGK